MEQINMLNNEKMENICRICLQKWCIMSPIFKKLDESKEFLSLADKISFIAQVQVEEGDGLPQSICNACQIQIDKYYDFRVLVEVSDRSLRSYLQAEKDAVDLKNVYKSDEYRKFTTESLPDDEFNLRAVNTIIVPTEEGMEVWKICDLKKEGENPEDDTYLNKDLSRLEQFKDVNELGLETDLMDPETCLTEVTERKTKVQRSQKCIRCKEFFRDEEELETHLQDHAVEDEENNLGGKINCQLCFESFSSLYALKIHIQDHVFDSRTITSKFTLKSDKEDPQQVDEKYHCSQCNQKFSTEVECSQHVRRHSEKKNLRCGICNKVFSKNSSRKRHELRHVEKRFDCPQCRKLFNKRSELRYHISCHVDTPPTCEICQKQFQNAQSLKLHMKRHTGESTFACKICGKTYYSNSELNRHIQIHLGRRDYPCTLCTQSFFSKPELTRHSKYHKGDKKFKCTVCSKSYFESGHLKIHLRIHTGEKPFNCDICTKAFISKSKLIRHQKIHMKNDVKQNDKTAGIESGIEFVDICELVKY